MGSERTPEKVCKWIAQGRLSQDRIMSRFDDLLREVRGIYPDYMASLQTVFPSVCSGAHPGECDIVTESAFLSLLEARVPFLRNREGAEVGRIIYAMLAYLSTLPFPPQKSYSDGLSLNRLVRGLAWALPDNARSIFEQSNFSRVRTRSDHERLLFQSLATDITPSSMQDEVRRQTRLLADRHLFDGVSESNYDLCKVNHDDDGDEIYFDLLEVLYSTQEERAPGMSPVSMDGFRDFAKRMRVERGMPEIHTLCIPAPRFEVLVKTLLALQFDPVTVEQDVVEPWEYDDAAKCICATFTQHLDQSQDANTNSGFISWPSYSRALQAAAPFLFYPFYLLLEVVLLNKATETSEYNPTEPIPHIPDGAVLTRPRVSQLNTFLAHSFYVPDLRRVACYTSAHLPTATSLVETILSVPDEAIVLFAGGSPSLSRKGEPYVFGLFSPAPKADSSHIRSIAEFNPDSVGQQECSLFQLAPRQDVFRGVVGAPGWSLIVDASGDQTLVFGQTTSANIDEDEKGGVILVLRDGLRRGEVRHRGKGIEMDVNWDVDDTAKDVVYEANPYRGDWVLQFDIEQIEVWSEIEE